MAVNEIVLVANGNGHGHVIVRWGHGLLRKRGKKRDIATNLIRYQRLQRVNKLKQGIRVKAWTQRETEREGIVTIHKHSRNTKQFKILRYTKAVNHKKRQPSSKGQMDNNGQPCMNEWYREQPLRKEVEKKIQDSMDGEREHCT